MLVIAALVFWRFRRYVWFWLVLALLALGHAVMVARVPWQWTNRLTAPEVWPLGMGDLLIDVGCIRLVAWLVGMRARS